MRALIFPALLFAALTSASVAQTAAQTDGPVTLHTQAKLVVEDVVVTDKNHHPIHDLKLSDFSVQESGKPQTIGSFEEHRPPSAEAAVKLPVLPAGYFTNDAPAAKNRPVNILLLDALNTPMQDQTYVREQLVAYLKTAKPGANVAIFGLSSKLVMLQSFTSDPQVLRAAVAKLSSKASSHLDDVVGGNGTPNTADDINQQMDNVLSDSQVAQLQTFMDIQQSFQTMQRVRYTLDAMNALARYLAAIPGRKNLIWFSGSFPLDIMPDVTGGGTDVFASVADAEDEYRETSSLLTRAQVAVYPIDARGLMTSPTMGGAVAGAKYAHNPKAFANDSTNFVFNSAAENSIMQRMAEDTGGRAYVGTNGLTEAVEKAVEDGSSYYTLTYAPTDPRSKGEYRKIEVKLAQQGYTLSYRRGYYADESTTGAVSSVAATDASGNNHDPKLILREMTHGMPPATQILYQLRVVPTTGKDEDAVAPSNIVNEPNQATSAPPYRRYSVDYKVLPNDISYTLTPDGIHHVVVEFVTVVYQPDGLVMNRVSSILRASLNPEQYKGIQQHGFPYHVEISVPVKGSYSLRTAVHDIRTNRIGATEIEVGSVKNLPPVNAVPATATPAHP